MDRRSATRVLHLSPSAHHGELLASAPRALSYRSGAVDAWQIALRDRLRRLVALPDPPRPSLAPVSLWRDSTELGTIEKLAFTSEAKADVLAYLCLPRDVNPPYPAVICLQGHTTGMHVSIGRDRDDESIQIQVEGDRDFAMGAMRRGFAALCIEQRSMGFRRELHQARTSTNGCHDAVMQALLLGRTLLGERVFDVDRGIDYLGERGDIDLERVGVMGNSGGGTVSIYAAALLPRIGFALPSCAFCSFAESLMAVYHCGDNYVPGILAWAEMWDVMGLFAPRPVTIVAGREDPLFPVEGVEAAFARLHSIYRAAGRPENCRLVVGEGGHRFYADAGWESLEAQLVAHGRGQPAET